MPQVYARCRCGARAAATFAARAAVHARSASFAAHGRRCSVFAHPERFAPLHTVASALVEHLSETYDVGIEEGCAVLSELPHVPDFEHVTRGMRLTPRIEHAAPITFVWTTAPGMLIYDGALFDAAYPSCSCNACNERWNECADALEAQVFSIVAGRLFEQLSEPKCPRWRFGWGIGFTQGMGQTLSYSLRGSDGVTEQGGQTRADSIPPHRLEAARATLDAVHAASPTGNWLAWEQQSQRRSLNA